MMKSGLWSHCARVAAGALAIEILSFGVVQAEEWPNKPVTMIIPLPAGGATDAVLRLVAREMSGSLGQQVVVEHWRRSVDMKLEHIPYKGEPQAVLDLVAGRLQLYISPAPYLDFVASGKLKALATTGPRRTSMQPDIPTMEEAGYPEATMSVLFGLAGPANLPAEIAQKLTNAALAAIRTPALRQRLGESGYILRAEGAPEMLATVQADIARFRRIAVEAGISVDQ